MGYLPGSKPAYALPKSLLAQPGNASVINQQPMVAHIMGDGEVWMQSPNCSPGLEYLTTIDSFFVKQEDELLKTSICFKTSNKYAIKNKMGQKVFAAVEVNDCCIRNCCGSTRPFELQITDAHHQEVIRLSRPLQCDSCCCPCCLEVLEVSEPPGNVIGLIVKDWSIFWSSFSIKNETGETVFKIKGPCCSFRISGNVEFKLLTLDGKQVGKISKQWSGFAREMFTDTAILGINFPEDLDVRMKAVMLGALFLIVSLIFFVPLVGRTVFA